MGGVPYTLVDEGGLPVSESDTGTPMTPHPNDQGLPVTLVESGGMPVTFIDDDFTPLPGGGLVRIALSSTTIDEAANIGDLVATMSVTGGSGTYTFSITADPDSKFAIDGVDNTRLELGAAPDRYYLNSSYSVTIEADNGVDAVLSRTFTISVTPAIAPSFTSDAAQTVADDAAFSLELATDEPCTFAIIGGADADQFDLTADDLTTAALDYDNPQDSDLNNTYIVDVRATSVATGLTADRTFTITVQGSFDPASLFASSEQGIWLDPSDFSTLWQDTSATTPVTAAGQTVARIDDKSGNGHIISQTAFSARRPVLQQDAQGKYYIDFDGSDDLLESSANVNFSAVDAVTIIAGVYKDSAPGTANSLVELTTNSSTTTNSFCLFAPSSGTDQYLFGSRGNAASRINATTTSGTYAAGNKHVVAGIADVSDDSVILRINKTQVGSSTTDQGTGNYSSAVLFVGSRNGAAIPFNGRLYGLIVRGATTSGATLTDAEDWMNGKIGAY